MLPAIVSGIVTGDAPVSYWPIFFLSLGTVPEVFANVAPNLYPFITNFYGRVNPFVYLPLKRLLLNLSYTSTGEIPAS